MLYLALNGCSTVIKFHDHLIGVLQISVKIIQQEITREAVRIHPAARIIHHTGQPPSGARQQRAAADRIRAFIGTGQMHAVDIRIGVIIIRRREGEGIRSGVIVHVFRPDTHFPGSGHKG